VKRRVAMRWPEIRDAVVGDAPVIAALACQLGYSTTTEEAAARLGAVLTRGEDGVLVAEERRLVVGWAQVTPRHTVESGSFAELIALVVDETRRNAGLGGRLVDAVEAWARQRGFSTVRVRSNIARDAATHRFYRRRGYEQVKVQAVYDKPLRAGRLQDPP